MGKLRPRGWSVMCSRIKRQARVDVEVSLTPGRQVLIAYSDLSM